jgi:hypothetical protein
MKSNVASRYKASDKAGMTLEGTDVGMPHRDVKENIENDGTTSTSSSYKKSPALQQRTCVDT